MMRGLSDYWAGESTRALAGAGSVEKRLAIALVPIRSVIRVIDDNLPPMTVDWAKVGKDDAGKPLSISFTDFGNKRIAVNPLPIIMGTLPPADQIDVAVGFAMHEAAHAKHSRDRWRYLTRVEDGKEVPAFAPMRVATWLWNLAEDVRIEDATSRDWPGFAAYFERVLAWIWGGIEERSELPAEYGPDVAGKLRTVFLACRFPGRARDLLPAAIQPEVDWWSAWQRAYLAGEDVPTAIGRALDRLGDDPAARAEMDGMAEDERAERERGEKLRAQIDRLIREGIGPRFCIREEGDFRPLTPDESEAVDRLVREGLVSGVPIIPHSGAGVTEIRCSKPSETDASRRAYVGRPDGATEALRAAIVFRNESPRHDIKLQRRGEMDDEEVWRWGTGDYRLFTERVVEDRPDTLLGLLVDLSGSMCGDLGYGTSKLATAQRLAQLFVWATHDMEGVTTRVWGHTGDTTMGEGSDIYRLWEPGDPLRRLGLISALRHANNYDGHAIGYVVDRMKDREQPQKVLIVLSDGYPAGMTYGGREAERHVRRVTDWARAQGVEVIQVAIDEELRPADQAAMFGEGNWVPFRSERELPRQLTAILGRYAK